MTWSHFDAQSSWSAHREAAFSSGGRPVRAHPCVRSSLQMFGHLVSNGILAWRSWSRHRLVRSEYSKSRSRMESNWFTISLLVIFPWRSLWVCGLPIHHTRLERWIQRRTDLRRKCAWQGLGQDLQSLSSYGSAWSSLLERRGVRQQHSIRLSSMPSCRRMTHQPIDKSRKSW